MKRINHKYSGKFTSVTRDSGIAQCIKCGLIKQYVKGKPTYFINDNVYLKSPNCIK